MLHSSTVQSEFLSQISELDQIKNKNQRIKSEKWKLRHFNDFSWSLPLFDSEAVDKTVTQEPIFSGKPKPLQLSNWEKRMLAAVVPPAELVKPKNGSGDRDKKNPPPKKPKGLAASTYKCNFCGGLHQKGQQCAAKKRKNARDRGRDRKRQRRETGPQPPETQ